MAEVLRRKEGGYSSGNVNLCEPVQSRARENVEGNRRGRFTVAIGRRLGRVTAVGRIPVINNHTKLNIHTSATEKLLLLLLLLLP